jgi:hypothetical protein
MENTVHTRLGRKRKASIRDRGTPAKKKRGGTKKAQVRRCLNKSAKQGVFKALKEAISSPSSLDQADSGSELLASVLQEVDSQLYIHTFPCRAEFWEKFKVTDLMAGICKALGVLHTSSVTMVRRNMQIFKWSGTENVAYCYWRTLLKLPTLCIVSGIHTERITPINVPSTTVMQY